MKRWCGWLLAMAVSPWLPLDVYGAWIEGVRHHASEGSTRVVLDLNGTLSTEPHVISLRSPDRLVIDLAVEGLSQPAPAFTPSSVVHGLRTGQHQDYFRLVLDLKEPVTFTTLHLPGDELQPDRLVLDLTAVANEGGANLEDVIAAWSSLDFESLGTRSGAADGDKRQQGERVIAVDAGHGGRDPGAIGRGGTYEKDVVLAMAKRLKRLIDETPGYRAVLTRTGDYYVELRDRVSKARNANADLFISIHADAVERIGPRGGSVYALSRRGATSTTAQWLAQSENEAFLTNDDGPLYLADEDPAIRNTLLDLSMGASQATSIALGTSMLAQLGGVTKLHKPNVELANFAVLRSPDMPSVLVETGFISTPEDERLLLDSDYQEQLMSKVLLGIKSFYD